GSSVSVDDIAGGEIAVQHLASLGRRRIGVVAARQDLRQVADRLRGARRAAETAGIELEVLDAEDLTVLAGRTVGEAVVARPRAERPDAVFCVNDLLAVGMLQSEERRVGKEGRARWAAEDEMKKAEGATNDDR